MTRSQRKASAELRESRRTAERLRRQRASYRKHNKPGIFTRLLGTFHSWHVAVRGLLLVLVVIVGITWIHTESTAAEEHRVADIALVQSVESQDALVVNRPWWSNGKTETTYVEIQGQRVLLSHGGYPDVGPSVGSTIQVVVDPADKSHIVATNFDDPYVPTDFLDYLVSFIPIGLIIIFSLTCTYLIAFLFLGPELLALAGKVRKKFLPNWKKSDNT